MTTITSIQETYVDLYNDIPTTPGRYGNNRKARRALSKRFEKEMLALCPTLTEEMLIALWRDMRAMADLVALCEE